MENCFSNHHHQVKERSNGCAHDEVISTAELDEGNDGEDQACDHPTRVTPFDWSKQKPEDAAFEQKEDEEVFEDEGLEATGLGGGVGCEEESRKKKDDDGGEENVTAQVFEWGFEVGLFDEFDE